MTLDLLQRVTLQPDCGRGDFGFPPRQVQFRRLSDAQLGDLPGQQVAAVKLLERVTRSDLCREVR
jgi:hypothetical protein